MNGSTDELLCHLCEIVKIKYKLHSNTPVEETVGLLMSPVSCWRTQVMLTDLNAYDIFI